MSKTKIKTNIIKSICMNWGNKILLVFLVFAAGIFYMVYRSMHVNYELVSKEYYKDEIRYQDIIDASKRASALSKKIEIRQNGDVITVQWPDEMKNEKVTGVMWFYCAADEAKDRHISLQLDQHGAQQIAKQKLVPGSYIVKLDWTCKNTRYYSEEPLTILQ
jgi:nitrogen fixation protein FixH